MSTPVFPRPAADEHAPYYARYVALVPEGDLLATLEGQLDEFRAFIEGIPESRGGHAYAAGKWSIREVVGHVIDTERIFAYRALRIARGDKTPLPGFDENAYAPESLASGRTLAELVAEFALVRQGNLALFRSLTPEVAARRGVTSEKPVSVRAIAWIMAGHLAHHMEILREKYL